MTKIPLLDIRAQRIVVAGRALYGDRWQRKLADKCKFSQKLINFVALGQRAVTDKLELKVAALLEEEIVRLKGNTRELERIRREILREHKGLGVR